MTLLEALRSSKETGRMFTRDGSAFTKYDADWTYELTADEILADDWEDVETYIPRLTNGRYEAAKPHEKEP